MKTPTREDYELAAKAAGFHLSPDGAVYVGSNLSSIPGVKTYSLKIWQPLDDDGDSRRLEVATNATIFRDSRYLDAVVHGLRHSVAYTEHDNDKAAAARGAVFWLAVEIGRAMP